MLLSVTGACFRFLGIVAADSVAGAADAGVTGLAGTIGLSGAAGLAGATGFTDAAGLAGA